MWRKLGPFTVFDLETTGMSPVRDRIVELAAIRIDCDGTVTHYESLVNPGRSIPHCATAVHHISNEMVLHAPRFTDVAYAFLDLAKGSTLVAHNARFDLGFLQESLARSGMKLWNGKTLDTLRLLHRTHAGLPSYSLQNLRRYFQLSDAAGADIAHRAGSDVEWTVQILGIALNQAIKMSTPPPER